MLLRSANSALLLLGSSAATTFVARLDLTLLSNTGELNQPGFRSASFHGFFQIELMRNAVPVDSVFIAKGKKI
jgi:hypothetical protein